MTLKNIGTREAAAALRKVDSMSNPRVHSLQAQARCFKLGLTLILSVVVTAPDWAQTTPPSTSQGAAPPKTWIDPDTGHRVTRLSEEPDSKALYFNKNAYTRDGKDMIYFSPVGIHDLNLATLQSRTLWQGHVVALLVGTRTRKVFFRKFGDPHLSVIDIDAMAVQTLGLLPRRAELGSINADETKIAGTYVEGTNPDYSDFELKELQDEAKALRESHQQAVETHARALVVPDAEGQAKSVAMEKTLAAHIPQDLFVMDISTGKTTVILKGTDWLNHVQFSPTDPTLIMYAHEGPPLEVDRIWTIRSDGSHNQSILPRVNATDSITHEFWSHDGATIWYDFQSPKGHHYFLGGYDVATGNRRLVPMKTVEASLHFNVSFDGKLFCGDGDKPGHSDKAAHGQTTLNKQWLWIKELLPPNQDSISSEGRSYTGRFHSEPLVSMSKHNYNKLEPNARLSPDGKLVIFNSNMFGPTYVFAVEVKKETPSVATN